MGVHQQIVSLEELNQKPELFRSLSEEPAPATSSVYEFPKRTRSQCTPSSMDLLTSRSIGCQGGGTCNGCGGCGQASVFVKRFGCARYLHHTKIRDVEQARSRQR